MHVQTARSLHHRVLICHSGDAIRSLSNILGDILPIKQSFFDSLKVLDSMELSGSLLMDLSIKAAIPKNLISSSNYGDIDVTVLVNRFKTTASFAVDPFSLSLPLALPGGATAINFNLTDARFGSDLFVNATNISITELFSDDQETSLKYGGTLFVDLPLTVGVAGRSIGIGLTVTDQNLFAPNPKGK